MRTRFVRLIVSVHLDEEPVEVLLKICPSASQVDIIIDLFFSLIFKEEGLWWDREVDKLVL